jgi:hypothetical protein
MTNQFSKEQLENDVLLRNEMSVLNQRRGDLNVQLGKLTGKEAAKERGQVRKELTQIDKQFEALKVQLSGAPIPVPPAEAQTMLNRTLLRPVAKLNDLKKELEEGAEQYGLTYMMQNKLEAVTKAEWLMKVYWRYGLIIKEGDVYRAYSLSAKTLANLETMQADLTAEALRSTPTFRSSSVISNVVEVWEAEARSSLLTWDYNQVAREVGWLLAGVEAWNVLNS